MSAEVVYCLFDSIYLSWNTLTAVHALLRSMCSGVVALFDLTPSWTTMQMITPRFFLPCILYYPATATQHATLVCRAQYVDINQTLNLLNRHHCYEKISKIIFQTALQKTDLQHSARALCAISTSVTTTSRQFYRTSIPKQPQASVCDE